MRAGWREPRRVRVVQGVGPYAHDIKKLEDDIKATLKKVNEKMGMSAPIAGCEEACARPMKTNACVRENGARAHSGRVAGVKESDTGLAPPNLWDLQADKMMMQEEQPLQVTCPGNSQH